ncbi:AraC family transcriptional regulator [Paraburkholderia sp. J63]|uniref:helix-turn-helix domain-containing protein n=1 Tax=Paraburkholderia sp. J63 TaxID=2805434 RepID=UPI002ABE5162|nr:AraC family transcriptional regulator [Paraburkholderia sp. J63]
MSFFHGVSDRKLFPMKFTSDLALASNAAPIKAPSTAPVAAPIVTPATTAWEGTPFDRSMHGLQPALTRLPGWRGQSVPTTDARTGRRAQHGLRTRAGVERVIAHIHASPGGDLGVATLAARACLSMWRFTVIFKGLTGESPHRYVTRIRIEHAQKLLCQGVAHAAAAQASGFYDQSHLSRAMKANCGMSPKQFQQQPTGDTPARLIPLSSASYT